MNKKLMVLLIFSLLIISVCGGMVLGDEPAENKGIISFLQESVSDGFLGYIFHDFTTDLKEGTKAGIVGGRILFAFLIFSLLFGVSQVVLKGYEKNLRVGITFLIGLISALAIPATLIQQVALMWGGIFYLILMGGPAIGMLYLLLVVYKGENRVDYLIKFVIAAVGSFIVTIVGGSFGGMIGAMGTVAGGIWSGFDTIFSLVGTIYLCLAVYYLIKFFLPDTSEAVAEGAEKIPSNLKKWWSKRGRPEFGKVPDVLNHLKNAIIAKDADDTERYLKTAEKLKDSNRKLVAWTYSQVDKLDTTNEAAVKKVIDDITAGNKKIEDKLDEIGDKLKEAKPDFGEMNRFIKEAITNQRAVSAEELKLVKYFK